MNKLLIGVGILFAGLFFTAAVFRAAPMTGFTMPFYETDEAETYDDRPYGPRGGCHGDAYSEDETFQGHHWDDSDFYPYDQAYVLMHLSEEERAYYETEYAQRVNALDLEDYSDDEALAEALRDIRLAILSELEELDTDE